ncbi:hypothetical protein GCK32_017357 [Trichostrongylus colubriformis]|uniref:Uncharacterized protein n=1 Tax=Trichostrongylus colubriformis TaxID=6319 RepID=A0AAN8FEG4_TRICO
MNAASESSISSVLISEACPRRRTLCSFEGCGIRCSPKRNSGNWVEH